MSRRIAGRIAALALCSTGLIACSTLQERPSPPVKVQVDESLLQECEEAPRIAAQKGFDEKWAAVYRLAALYVICRSRNRGLVKAITPLLDRPNTAPGVGAAKP